MVPPTWLILGLLVLVCTSQVQTQGTAFSLPCHGNLSTLPRVSSHPGNPAYQLKISHPFMDAENGIIPGVVYQVVLHEVDSNQLPFKRFLLRVTSDTDEADVGNFTSFSNEVRAMQECDNTSNSILTNSDFSEKVNVTVQWITPSVIYGCYTFRASIIDTLDNVHDLEKMLCERKGCYKYMTDTQGSLFSPGFPSKYADSLSCLYFIQVPPAFVIKLQKFDLEPSYEGHCYDYVTVAPQEMMAETSDRLCGRYQGVGYRNLSFVSDGNFMVIKFVTDDKIAGQGFQAFYYASNISGCFVNISGMTGNISSVNYPAPYFPLFSCTYHVTVPSDYHLALTFLDFDLPRSIQGECVDYIAIETSEHPDDVILCGDKNTVTSSLLYYETHSNWIRLKFSSDYLNEGRGFLARFSAVQLCLNQTYTTPNGTVMSINFPEPYLNLQECYISIKIPEKAMIIDLQFLEFNTEAPLPTYMQGKICDRDYIEIYDGVQWRRFCGDWNGQIHRLRFKSLGSTMTLRFKSNSVTTAPGFKAVWRSIPENGWSIPCPGPWMSFSESCLRIGTTPMTWQQAQSDCQRYQAHLVHITNKDKKKFVTSLLQNSSDHETSSAYWIGATDFVYEGEFFWTDNTRINFSDWFPGWPSGSNVTYNQQPNDDGLSQQDCVEMRQLFSLHSKGSQVADDVYWNDRECDAKNYYVCERTKHEFRPIVSAKVADCDDSIYLTPSQPDGVVVSPGHPFNYESFLNCNINISTPPGYIIEVTFKVFDLEESNDCEYDRLHLQSSMQVPGIAPVVRSVSRCGNWTSKLKLLRFISTGNLLQMKFLSDQSEESKGFHANFVMRKGQSFCPVGWTYTVDSCYQMTTTEVSYTEAIQFCATRGGHLLDFSGQTDLHIAREAIGSGAKGQFWAGITQDGGGIWRHINGSLVNRSATQIYLPVAPSTRTFRGLRTSTCFVVIQVLSDVRLKPVDCNLSKAVALCTKLITEHTPPKFIATADTNGSVSSPFYPVLYSDDIDIIWTFNVAKELSLLFVVKELDVEYQEDCLYDYLLIGEKRNNFDEGRRFCGKDMKWFSYAVHSNNAFVRFVTDYIIQRHGFLVEWSTVDVGHCDKEEIIDITKTSDVVDLRSPNFPQGYLNDLHCRTVIKSPPETRIYLVFSRFRLNPLPNDCADYVELLLDSRGLSHLNLCAQNSSHFKFLSLDNYTEIIFHTDDFYNEVGFEAHFSIVSEDSFLLEEELRLTSNQSASLVSLNWPLSNPSDYQRRVRLVAPVGYVISVVVASFDSSRSGSTCSDYLQILDAHLPSRVNMTKFGSILSAYNCDQKESLDFPAEVTSYLNSIMIRFVASTKNETRLPVYGLGYALKYSVMPDPAFVNKTRQELDILLDKCDGDTCHNNATCLGDEVEGYHCNCSGPYRGLLCAHTFCDSHPCRNGATCHNLDRDYNCSCPPTYGGKNCQLNIRFCALTNCRGHGTCFFLPGWQLACSCNQGWTGDHCEQMRTLLANRKNRGSRLLEEPFWIGIIVVLGVLAVTGLVVLIRKKFARRLHCNCCPGLPKQVSGNPDPNKLQGILSVNGGHDGADRRNLTFYNAAFTPGSSPKAATPQSQASPSWDKSNMPVIKVHLENDASRPTSDLEEGENSNVLYVIHNGTPPEPPPSPSSDGTLLAGSESHDVTENALINHSLRRSSSFNGHISRIIEEECNGDMKTFSTSLDMGMSHPRDKTSKDIKSRKSLSVGLSATDSEEKGSEHYRVNSSQRRRQFVDSVRRARYQSIIDNDQPKSNHSSGSQCRSCGSCCSYHSFESDLRRTSNDSRHTHGSTTSMRDTFSMSVDTADTTMKGHHHRHSTGSDDGVFLCRTSSRTSDVSGSSKHTHRRSHHRHRAHKRKHHHHVKHSGLDDWYYRGSKRHFEYPPKPYSFDRSEDYYHRDSPRSSRSDFVASRPSMNSHGGHLKLSRTISRDWSSEVDIQYSHKHRHHKGVHRRHKKVEAVRSDGSASSARSLQSPFRPKPVVRKSYSVNSRELNDMHPFYRHQSMQENFQSGNSSDERFSLPSRAYYRDYSDQLQIPSHETTMSDYGTITSSDASPHVTYGLTYISTEGPSEQIADAYLSSSDQETADTTLQTSAEINLTINVVPDKDETTNNEVADVQDSDLVKNEDNAITEEEDDDDDDDFDDVLTIPIPKSSPENQEKYEPHQQAAAEVVNEPGSNKHPLRDSAYQSKEQSTEKSNSTAVSPTLSNNGFRPKEDVFTLHKPLPARMEDKRVTNQLELAARKLVALQELEERSLSTEERNDSNKMDLPISNGCLLHAEPVHPKTKVRLTLPSRMLSMIADEECESSTESDRGRSRPSLSSPCRSFEEDGVPMQDMSVKSAVSLTIPEMGFLYEEHATEV